MAFIFQSFCGDLIVLLICLFGLLYMWFRRRYTYWEKMGVYSPEPSFPTGHIEGIVYGTLQIGQQFEEIYYAHRKRPFIGIYMMHKVALVVNDLDLIKNILVKDFMHFTDHGLVHHEESEPLEGHLFNINGNRWRNIRVRLLPSFTSAKMKTMFDTVVMYGKVVQDYVESKVSAGQVVDVKETLSRFSTDIIGTCVFGIECNSIKSEVSMFRNMSKKSQRLPFLRSLIQTMSLMAPSIVANLRVSMYQNDVNDFFSGQAKQAMDYRIDQNISRNDYLQVLMKLQEERRAQEKEHGKILDEDDDATMTIGDLAAQFFVFFVDGVETSSTASSFAMFELARNPDVQKKLRDEIDEVVERHGGKISFDALTEMKYLNQVVEESLRMYPPLPLVLRVCTKDYTIPETDIVIKKGTSVMIPIMGIHRDPEIYPDPMKFNPDRFSAENKAERHRFAHIPFGEGPRMCMGTRFGSLMARMGLYNIISKYEITIDEKYIEPGEFEYNKNSFILSPIKGINVTLSKRKLV